MVGRYNHQPGSIGDEREQGKITINRGDDVSIEASSGALEGRVRTQRTVSHRLDAKCVTLEATRRHRSS